MSGKREKTTLTAAAESSAKVARLPDSSSSETNRASPHSQDAERALIGALLLDNNLYFEVDDVLLPEMFYVPAHGRVFDAIARLMGKQQVADPVSLTGFFGSADWFVELGGRSFLEGLYENATKIINVRTYANIVFNAFLSRELISIGSEIVNEAYEPENTEDPASLIDQAEGRLFKLAERGMSEKSIQTLRKPLNDMLARIEAARAADSHLTGVTTGLVDVDNLLGGLQNSDLIILAARPSMGKTSLALNIALNAANARTDGRRGGVPVAVFSLEMSNEQLAVRLTSSEASINTQAMTQGKLTLGDFERLARVADHLAAAPIYLDDTPQLPINQMRNRARRMKRQFDIGLIVVDYLQLMRGSSSRSSENRVQEISEISQGLKSIARELNIPVIALSQLSRSVESRENKRPQLSDLRESGSIEQDADIVMFLYREIYYKERELGADASPEKKAELDAIRNKAELLISKNRKGPVGVVNLTFDGATTTFRDYSPAAYPESVRG